MAQKKIWIARYANGLMPDTQVTASDENDARKEAVAVYRYHSMMHADDRWEGDVVESVELAEDQSVIRGAGVMPASEYPPEKPVVDMHFQENA